MNEKFNKNAKIEKFTTYESLATVWGYYLLDSVFLYFVWLSLDKIVPHS